MKKNLLILVITGLLLNSCHTASFRFSPISSQHTVAYDLDAKWLFISQSAPAGFASKASENAYQGFKEILGNSLTHVSATRGLMGIQNIPLQPSQDELKKLKAGTGYNFIIHLRFSQRNSDSSGLMIGRNEDLNLRNEVFTVIEIYDLDNLDVINIQEVVGSYKITENKHDVSFAESTEQIANRSVRRILKKLK